MMEMIKRIRYVKMNSGLARQVLGLFFHEGESYRVPFGPIRGTRLYYDRSVNYHSILGLWESESYAFLDRLFREANLLKPGMVGVDLGANLGYFSIWLARKVASVGGVVHAFEPAPPVLEMLRKNLAENGITNARIVDAACSESVGKLEFFVSDTHHKSSLVESWADSQHNAHKVSVRATTLDEYFFGTADGGPHRRPDFIKIDIEGGGVYALKSVDRCLRETRPLIWIESHTPEEDRAICDLLVRLDYQAFRLEDRKMVSDRTATYPNPEGVRSAMLLLPTEKHSSLARLLH